MCKVYTGYCGTSEIEHGLCACMADNPLAKARGLSPYRRTNRALSLNFSMADGISFDVSLSLNCTECTKTEEGLRNWTITSRLWKLDYGLYAPPP